MHVNVPMTLSFVCGAPFSKAAGDTSEDQLGMPEVFARVRLSSFFLFSCWFKRKDVAEDMQTVTTFLGPFIHTTDFFKL